MSLRHPVLLALPVILLGAGAQAAGFGPTAAHQATARPDAALQTVQQTVIIAPSLPPPPREETVPPPPPPGRRAAHWRPGHWNWSGSNWVWIHGAYVVPPQPTATWTPGHWQPHADGGYRWIPGHW